MGCLGVTQDANFAGLRHEFVGEQSLSEQAVAAEGRARPARP